MNMNNERFFDLAMKVIASQAADAERAELKALLASQPELHAEFARLTADARVTKEALLMMDKRKHRQVGSRLRAWEASNKGAADARTPGGKTRAGSKYCMGWRWILGLAQRLR